MKKKVIIFLLVALILSGGVYYFYFQTYWGKTNTVEEKNFEIKEGESLFSIAENLKREKLIPGKIYFYYYLKTQGLNTKIIPGHYLLGGQMGIPEIAFRLTQKEDPVKKEIALTFPEGWNLEKISQRIDANGLNQAGDFSALTKNPAYFKEKYGYEFLSDLPKNVTLEGFLFPDTYFFAPEATSEEIIKKMLDNFEQKVTPDLKKEILARQRTLYEIVTLASLLEMEVKSQEDRELVSGIFWNRIKIGQPLQSCATLAYVLGVNKKQYRWEDTQVVSPYNTYLNQGLPPGPIGNPGMETLRAAIFPKDSNYNYFLSDPQSGNTIFSSSFEEHNQNKIKYGL